MNSTSTHWKLLPITPCRKKCKYSSTSFFAPKFHLNSAGEKMHNLELGKKVAAYSPSNMVFVLWLDFIVTYESDGVCLDIWMTRSLWKSLLQTQPTPTASPHGFPVAKTSHLKMIQTLARVEHKATGEQLTTEKKPTEWFCSFRPLPRSRELSWASLLLRTAD